MMVSRALLGLVAAGVVLVWGLLGSIPVQAAMEPPQLADPTAGQADVPPGGPTGEPTGAPAKVLYLTFDDGPSGYTQPILDVLVRHNAKATFFVLGRQATGKQDLLRAMYAAGHGIANHTYSHPYLTALSKQRFRDEVTATSVAAGGLDHGCLRPPYGASNKAVRAEAGELGYTVVTWSIDPRDWSRPGAAAIAQRVIGKAFPGGVVVMHDGGGDRTQTVAALETILTELGAQGYQFAALCRDGAPAAFTPPQQVQPGMEPENLLPAGPSGGIASPRERDQLHGTVAISGFARHPTFRKWQLDLLIDGVNETFLALGESPVAEVGELYVWDTARYPNGEHILRLRVVYEGLNYDEYNVPVSIRN